MFGILLYYEDEAAADEICGRNESFPPFFKASERNRNIMLKLACVRSRI
jgi:hypothetical protein